MSTEQPVTEDQRRHVRRTGRFMLVLAFVTFMIGIGGFGSASNGNVEMFGVTLQAKYACFLYFVLGAVFLWSTQEARKRGFKA